MREIFPAVRFHTYRTVFEPFNFSQKARCQSYRTLSSQKCPISLTALYIIQYMAKMETIVFSLMSVFSAYIFQNLSKMKIRYVGFRNPVSGFRTSKTVRKD